MKVSRYFRVLIIVGDDTLPRFFQRTIIIFFGQGIRLYSIRLAKIHHDRNTRSGVWRREEREGEREERKEEKQKNKAISNTAT